MPDEKDEKLKFLKRSEVRTMEKDISRLREAEAEKARGEMAEIKTGEELAREGGRLEQAQKAAEERKKIETEAEEKLAQSEVLRQARQNEELLAGKAREESEEMEKEKLRAQFRETQQKEEESRRKFLENISRQAGEEPVMPSMPAPRPAPPIPQRPTPPPAPATAPETPPATTPPAAPKFPLPKVQLPRVTGYFPEKPSIFAKIWIRIIVSLFILAILATIITFWYWYLAVREKPIVTAPALPEKIEVREAIPPASLIPVENTRALSISGPQELPNLLSQIIKEDFGESNFIRLLIKSGEKFPGLKEFFEAFQVKTPADLYSNINNDFTLFVFSSPPQNQLGFIAKTENPSILNSIMESWEKTLERDFDNLFLLLNENKTISGQTFLKSAYKDTTIHYLSLAENFGIVWAITDNYFIFSSSGKSAVGAIDKIKEQAF